MEYIWKVKDKSYNLKLRTKRVLQLEQAIGCNPLMIFGLEGDKIPSTKQLIAIIHAAIQDDKLMTEDVVEDLVDDWIEDGHTYGDLIPLIMDIYRASGLIEDNTEEDEPKNAKKPAKGK